MKTELRVRELVLNVPPGGEPMHSYGVYRELRERYHRKVAYSTCRRVLRELLREGRVRVLSSRETEGRGVQVRSNPSARSGWRPPIPRSYYQIK